MAVSSIAFTMYPVTGMQRATAFYTDVLGLQKTDFASDFWCEFDVAGATFGIGNFEQVGTPGSAQSLALEVPDVAALRASLAERGIEVSEPHDLKICLISVVRDPDGNSIWLHQTKPR